MRDEREPILQPPALSPTSSARRLQPEDFAARCLLEFNMHTHTSHNLVVLKFGGTSVKDARAIRATAEIVASRRDCHPVVVVSALAGVTDGLLKLAHSAVDTPIATTLKTLKRLEVRHLEVLGELTSGAPCLAARLFRQEYETLLESKFAELELLLCSVATLGACTPIHQDAIVAFGERLSSILVTAALQVVGIQAEVFDVRQVMITTDDFTEASPLVEELNRRVTARLLPLIAEGIVPVTQGFVGATLSGATTTLGRGGSDFTATLIGAALRAQSVEIWTDVDGVMTADPKLVPEAVTIPELSYHQAEELALRGAKVLHPKTLRPVRDLEIPVWIRNSSNPSTPGTLVCARPAHPPQTSLACQRNLVRLQVLLSGTNALTSSLSTLATLFSKLKLFPEHMVCTPTAITLLLPANQVTQALEAMLGELGPLQIERHQALVAVIGQMVTAQPVKGVEFSEAEWIQPDLSNGRFLIATSERFLGRVVRCLHDQFVQLPMNQVLTTSNLLCQSDCRELTVAAVA